MCHTLPTMPGMASVLGRAQGPMGSLPWDRGGMWLSIHRLALHVHPVMLGLSEQCQSSQPTQ